MLRERWSAELLPELAQLLSGNISVFGLQAMAMLFAPMLVHCKIGARLGAIQAFRDPNQNELAGLTRLRP
jgi:hypothetical protein